MKLLFDFSATRRQKVIFWLWIIGIALGAVCVPLIGRAGHDPKIILIWLAAISVIGSYAFGRAAKTKD